MPSAELASEAGVVSMWVWKDRLWKYLLTGDGLGAGLDVAGPASTGTAGITTLAPKGAAFWPKPRARTKQIDLCAQK